VIAHVRQRLAGARQVGWAFADQVVVSGMNFLTIVLLARFLGVSGLGIYSLAWMVVLFAGSLQGALIVSPMMSLGPRRTPGEADGYFAAMWRIQLRLAAACAGATFVGVELFSIVVRSADSAAFAAPLAIAVVSYQLQDFVRRYYFVRLRPRAALVNDVCSFGAQIGILMVLFTVLSTAVHMDPVRVLWVIALAPLVPTVWFSSEIRRLAPNPAVRDGLFLEQWEYSKWQVGSALLYWVSGNLMVVVSGIVLGTAAVGVLTAIRRIVNVSHVMMQGIENVVPTQCSIHLLEGGVESFRRYFRRTLGACVAVTATFSAMLAAFPAFWLHVVVGAEFGEYARELRMYAPYCVLLAFGLVLPAGLRAFAATRYMFLTSLLCAGASMLMAWPLVTLWGLDGAIVGVLLSQALTVVAYAIGLRRIIATRTHEAAREHHRLARTATADALVSS
jgi:O-antigen/teichoic acid export membrane protein